MSSMSSSVLKRDYVNISADTVALRPVFVDVHAALELHCPHIACGKYRLWWKEISSNTENDTYIWLIFKWYKGLRLFVVF